MMVAKKIGFVFSIFFILIVSKVWLSPDATTKEIGANTANSMPPYLMQLGIDLGIIAAVAGLWLYLRKKGQK